MRRRIRGGAREGPDGRKEGGEVERIGGGGGGWLAHAPCSTE